jgi:hypothetical protein
MPLSLEMWVRNAARFCVLRPEKTRIPLAVFTNKIKDGKPTQISMLLQGIATTGHLQTGDDPHQAVASMEMEYFVF